MAQAFLVLLVVRNAEGEVRWMEVRDWLKRVSDNGKKTGESNRLHGRAVRRNERAPVAGEGVGRLRRRSSRREEALS